MYEEFYIFSLSKNSELSSSKLCHIKISFKTLHKCTQNWTISENYFFVILEKWENFWISIFCNQFDQLGTQNHFRHVFKQSFILETLNLLTIWFGTISVR